MADDLAPQAAGDAVGKRQAADTPPVSYTGGLHRGRHDGTVEGFLVDALGYRITIRGYKDPRAGKGYTLMGWVSHIPEALRQPAIDNDR